MRRQKGEFAERLHCVTYLGMHGSSEQVINVAVVVAAKSRIYQIEAK